MDQFTGMLLRAVPLAVLGLAVAPRAGAVTAAVRPLNGAPALFIDGQPTNGLLFSCGPAPLPRWRAVRSC